MSRHSAGVGLTIGIVLLAHGLRGGLAVAVLLAAVVLLLAQVLLGRPWGWTARGGTLTQNTPVTR